MEDFQLSSLPVEVIDKIFAHLDLQDVVLLSRSASINAALGFCIAKYIRNNTLGFTNRVENVSFLGIYFLTPSFLEKGRMEFLPTEELFFDLLRFCKKVGKFFVRDLTITFYIWNLVDLIDFLKLVQKVADMDSGMTFNLELEFDPALPHYLNINPVLRHIFLPQFHNSVRSIMLTNYAGQFDFNVCDFPSLRRIWLINSNVKFKSSFQHNHNLQDLKIYPNMYGYRRNKFRVLRKGLGPNIRTLELGTVIIQPSCLSYPFPSHVRRINLRSVKDLTGGEYILRLLQASIETGSLEKVFLEDLFDIEKEYHMKIMDLLNAYIPRLLDLGLSNLRFDTNQIVSNWDKVTHEKMNILKATRCKLSTINLTLCNNLRKLDIGDNNIKDLTALKFPDTLAELFLGNNPINWNLGKVRFPPNLIRLNLKNTGIGKNLPLVHMPDNIRLLSLEVNNIESIDGVRFPKRLVILGIGSNRLANIDNHLLPVGLQVVHFTENWLTGPLNLRTNALGENLTLTSVYTNHNRITRLNEFEFPENLRVLCLDENPLKSIKDMEFPATLQELSIMGCEIREAKNVSFGTNSRLAILTLMNNSLKTLTHINLPETLEILNFSFNSLDNLMPTTFKHLVNLKKLNLSSNKLKKLYLTLNENLKAIDVSNNSIKLFSLQFEKDVRDSTLLSSVNLSTNALTSFNPTMIGLVDPIKHDNLTEIDLTENKIKATDIDLKQFPASLKSCVIGSTGQQDQFGYDLGKNIIDFDICQTKKIGGN